MGGARESPGFSVLKADSSSRKSEKRKVIGGEKSVHVVGVWIGKNGTERERLIGERTMIIRRRASSFLIKK